MNQLDRLEALVQHLIEGAFNRLFQTLLPPTIANKNREKNRAKTKEMIAINPTQKANHWLLRLGEQELRLGEPVVTIGRASDNDIVLSDPAVFPYHAQLRWREGCYHLCPPTPTNGNRTSLDTGGHSSTNQLFPQTAVNRQAVIQHALVSDDVITLGDTKLTVMVERGTA